MRASIALALTVLAAVAGWTAPSSRAAEAAPASAAAASAPAAAPQPADLFDFWLGDWSLTWKNADGSTGTGRNRITRILDGRVIQEDFEALTDPSPPLLKGRSLSVLNNGVWRQSWVDNQGGFFAFSARVDGERRLFVTEPRTLRDGRTLVQRMVFHTITPVSLTWDWERSEDGGRTWTRDWRVHYTR
ncbi:hypothetical protein [Rhizobacter fulvus]|jgi:hypothetical protein